MNKQDILNAFRKYFHPDVKVMPGAPLDETEQWLLTTLTEFEREVEERGQKKAAIKIARDLSKPFWKENKDAGLIHAVIWAIRKGWDIDDELVELEKEKHTKKGTNE